MNWELVRKLTLVVVAAAAVFVVFRQGWIPPRFSPLPPVDLANPYPLIVDWQLVELGQSRDLCRRVMAQKGVTARPVADKPIVDGCGWENAVNMIGAADASMPASNVQCGVAGGLALWIRHVVQPEAERLLGTKVARIGNMGVYSCRNIIGTRFFKNRKSQHATSNAIDIGSFRLANGQTISVLKHWSAGDNRAIFLRRIHRGACKYFRVVLGPEYNAAHRDHFHFDRGPFWRCV